MFARTLKIEHIALHAWVELRTSGVPDLDRKTRIHVVAVLPNLFHTTAPAVKVLPFDGWTADDWTVAVCYAEEMLRCNLDAHQDSLRD